MINGAAIANAFGVKTRESSEMMAAMNAWIDMYMNTSPWLKRRIESLDLPSAVASEFARLILTEFSASINDKVINVQFQQFVDNLYNSIEIGCAFGGLIFKPYNSYGKICTDIANPFDFVPVAYTDGMLTSVICTETFTQDDSYYTRAEYHKYDASNKTHTIVNLCFFSKSKYQLGSTCSLQSISEWADIQPKTVYTDVEQPLFVYFKMPFTNNIDLCSPLGVSVFAKSESLIKQADIHWERILWEFESSERAIDATEDIFRMKDGKPELPRGRERMFRVYDMETGTGKPFIETFSPEIRDISLFNGLNRIFQRIEYNCGLAYGTISDIQTVEKTAEEIKTSKQRSYANISLIQKKLQTALERLAYCYGYYSKYYSGYSADVSLTCTWGDGVLEDADKEFQRRMQMATSQMLKKELFISWYFGCSEEDAKKYLPALKQMFEDSE